MFSRLVHGATARPPKQTCIASHSYNKPPVVYILITAETGAVARAKGGGEKEKECIQSARVDGDGMRKGPWALNYGSGERGGVEKGRRRGGEKRAMHV